MAPRAPEPKEWFFQRLEKQAAAGAREVRFGVHHHSHAVCKEGELWRLRRLVLDDDKARAYLAEHGHFMPEHAEMLSEPGPDVLLEATSVAGLIAKLNKSWPL